MVWRRDNLMGFSVGVSDSGQSERAIPSDGPGSW